MEKAIADLSQQLADVHQKLAQNRSEMEAVRAANEKLAKVEDDATRQAHILGRISLFLESLPEVPDTKALAERAEILRNQCASLEEQLSDEKIEEKLESILSILSQQMTSWARSLAAGPLMKDRSRESHSVLLILFGFSLPKESAAASRNLPIVEPLLLRETLRPVARDCVNFNKSKLSRHTAGAFARC